MERSAIRERAYPPAKQSPGFAALHPGYDIEIVIASEAKQSSFLSCCAMDCFASLAMTSRYDSAISPHVSREVLPLRSALLNQRAQGMPGVRCAR
jgi:hypothetical protein